MQAKFNNRHNPLPDKVFLAGFTPFGLIASVKYLTFCEVK
jgi:hypothetical protein